MKSKKITILQERQDVLVTVVIPTKNGGKLFNEVMRSVFTQVTPWRFEVLVVDSASTDETIEIVRNYPDTRLIEVSPSEFAHGRTRNLAISASKGKFVAMLTQDALPKDSSWLLELVKPALEDSRIAGVFGRHVAYPHSTETTRHEIEQHFSGFSIYPVVELDDPVRYVRDEQYRQMLYFFSNNNSLLRRDVWEKLPLPEVDFAEDQAWAKKIIEAGYKKAYAENATVFHSHDYGLIERLQRGFDESYAMRRLFDHKQVNSLISAVRSWVALTVRDVNIIMRTRSRYPSLTLFFNIMLDNAMRIVGSYLGTHGKYLPTFLHNTLSRDKRFMRTGYSRGKY
jgi:rhamnosyltransferase